MDKNPLQLGNLTTFTPAFNNIATIILMMMRINKNTQLARLMQYFRVLVVFFWFYICYVLISEGGNELFLHKYISTQIYL